MDNIQILMGVYEGQAHLPAQLDSLAWQTHAQWQLRVSDDSPTDHSRRLLDSFGTAHPGRVTIGTGPQAGFAANYLHLLRQAGPGPLALADQDDVWTPDKLARAHAALATLPPERPALYCARVQPWDGETAKAPLPPLRRPTGFRNALIENVAMGNTIVLNPPAAALARDVAGRIETVFAHDWWLYQLISGVGGTVLHDDGPPVVLYRQHAGNAIGAGRGLAAQAQRKRAVLQGAFGQRLALNAAALRAAQDQLTPANAALFAAFETARTQTGPARLRALHRLGLYRQRRGHTLGFFAAAALGRV